MSSKPGGRIIAPGGLSGIAELARRHNIDNRRRLMAKVGRWQERFKIDEIIKLRGVSFAVRKKHDDLLILGNPCCTLDDQDKWYDAFRLEMIFPLYGFEFRVQEVYYNSLHLVCKGPTGQRRKGHYND